MSQLAALQAGSLIVLALLLLGAAWQDLRAMRIANEFPAAIVVIFAMWAGARMALGTASLADLGSSTTVAVGVFGCGAVAFAAGALGGGDVKLLSATSLFAGPTLLPDLILVTALAGGAMAIVVLAGVPVGVPAPERGAAGARLRSHLPCGPAIAVGGLWVAASLAMS